jgi:hypothetical protein
MILDADGFAGAQLGAQSVVAVAIGAAGVDPSAAK